MGRLSRKSHEYAALVALGGSFSIEDCFEKAFVE